MTSEEEKGQGLSRAVTGGTGDNGLNYRLPSILLSPAFAGSFFKVAGGRAYLKKKIHRKVPSKTAIFQLQKAIALKTSIENP